MKGLKGTKEISEEEKRVREQFVVLAFWAALSCGGWQKRGSKNKGGDQTGIKVRGSLKAARVRKV